MAKAKKRIAKRKKSSKRGGTSTRPVRKKMAMHTAAKARNPKPGVRGLKAARKTQTSNKLFFFDVDENGTITESDFKEPKINSEIFYDIYIYRLTTPEDIVDKVEYYGALVEHFRRLARNEQENLIHRIELQDFRDDKELQRMKRVAKVLENEDEGWKEWIKIEGNEGLPQFKKFIVDWLGAPIEWGEDMPNNATAVRSAKHFFEHQDPAMLDELGVWIVEGEFPGSTYDAAELSKTVKEANEIAQKLGLSYRFREMSKGTA